MPKMSQIKSRDFNSTVLQKQVCNKRSTSSRHSTSCLLSASQTPVSKHPKLTMGLPKAHKRRFDTQAANCNAVNRLRERHAERIRSGAPRRKCRRPKAGPAHSAAPDDWREQTASYVLLDHMKQPYMHSRSLIDVPRDSGAVMVQQGRQRTLPRAAILAGIGDTFMPQQTYLYDSSAHAARSRPKDRCLPVAFQCVKLLPTRPSLIPRQNGL